jgi:hypothetical protein
MPCPPHTEHKQGGWAGPPAANDGGGNNGGGAGGSGGPGGTASAAEAAAAAAAVVAAATQARVMLRAKLNEFCLLTTEEWAEKVPAQHPFLSWDAAAGRLVVAPSL